jgi:hypothetical protein
MGWMLHEVERHGVRMELAPGLQHCGPIEKRKRGESDEREKQRTKREQESSPEEPEREKEGEKGEEEQVWWRIVDSTRFLSGKSNSIRARCFITLEPKIVD